MKKAILILIIILLTSCNQENNIVEEEKIDDKVVINDEVKEKITENKEVSIKKEEIKKKEVDIVKEKELQKSNTKIKLEEVDAFKNEKWFPLLEEEYLKLDVKFDWENNIYSELLKIYGGKGFVYKENYFVFHNFAGLYSYDIEKNILKANSYPYLSGELESLLFELEEGYIKLISNQYADGNGKATFKYGKYFPIKNEVIYYLDCIGKIEESDKCNIINVKYGDKINEEYILTPNNNSNNFIKLGDEIIYNISDYKIIRFDLDSFDNIRDLVLLDKNKVYFGTKETKIIPSDIKIYKESRSPLILKIKNELLFNCMIGEISKVGTEKSPGAYNEKEKYLYPLLDYLTGEIKRTNILVNKKGYLDKEILNRRIGNSKNSGGWSGWEVLDDVDFDSFARVGEFEYKDKFRKYNFKYDEGEDSLCGI